MRLASSKTWSLDAHLHISVCSYFIFIFYNLVKAINLYTPIHQFPLCSISQCLHHCWQNNGNGELWAKDHLTDFYSDTDWKISTLSTVRVNSNHLIFGKRKQTCMFRNKWSVDRHRAMATRDSVPGNKKYVALQLLCPSVSFPTEQRILKVAVKHQEPLGSSLPLLAAQMHIFSLCRSGLKYKVLLFSDSIWPRQVVVTAQK